MKINLLNKVTGLLVGGSLLIGGIAHAADKVQSKEGDLTSPTPVVEPEVVNQSLTVDDAVKIALENNLDVQIAGQNKKVYQSQYKAYSLKRLGNIKITNHAYKASNSTGKELQDYGYDDKYLGSRRNAGGVQLTVPILDVTLDARVNQAGIQSENAKRSLEKQIEDTMLATETYYNYANFYNKEIDTSKQYLNNMREFLRLANDKYQYGKVSKVDVLNAEVEVAKANQKLIEAKANYDIYIHELKKALHLGKNVNITLKEDLETLNISPKTQEILGKSDEELINIALNNRKDLKIAEGNLKIAKKEVTAAVGENLPTLSLVASNSWNTIHHSGFDDFCRGLGYDFDTRSSDIDRSVGVYMSFALDGSNIEGINTAKQKVKSSKLTVEKIKEQIETEIKQTKLNVLKTLEKIKSNRIDLKAAITANELANERYKRGLSTAYERINSQQELNDSRNNYAYSLAEAKISISKLKNLLGTSIKVAEDKANVTKVKKAPVKKAAVKKAVVKKEVVKKEDVNKNENK